MRGEYDYEPVRGLPETLPTGESQLWQGSPDWKNTAMRVLHIRGTAIYFALLLAWYAESKLSAGEETMSVILSVLRLGMFAVLTLALMGAYAWFSARSTIYTVTNRRVVMRTGIALPMILNLPFGQIEAADIKTYADGSGDIALTLPSKDRVAYLMLWPHVQPWRMARARPMLRGIKHVRAASDILGRALSGAVSGSAQTQTLQERPSVAAQRPRAAAMA